MIVYSHNAYISDLCVMAQRVLRGEDSYFGGNRETVKDVACLIGTAGREDVSTAVAEALALHPECEYFMVDLTSQGVIAAPASLSTFAERGSRRKEEV